MINTDVQTGPNPGRGSAFGSLLRQWRPQRGMSQLELSLEADVSARYPSVIETGRSGPSAGMPQYQAGPRVSEIEASRARILAAADEARRELERNLHDGAQQRLVLASLWLKRAAARTRGTAAEELVSEAHSQLQEGLAELRDLARGLHSAVLSERGIADAVRALTVRSPLPVDLQVTPERLPPAVERAVYFTVAEALTNVAKHAHATRASVTIEIVDGTLLTEIADDGTGGASLDAGSGLQGLADRLDAVGGTLSIHSPDGRGTTIRAQAPLR